MKLLNLTVFFTYFLVTFGEQPKFEGYVFVYFTGERGEGERIRIAASNGNDALHWSELKGGQPILTSNYGTRGLRDPFIIRSHDNDKFYLLATDLSSVADPGWKNATRFGSRYIEVWESKDLVNWSEQRHTLVSPPEAGCSWAPEAHYDKDLGEYIVYWAPTLYSNEDTARVGPTYHRLMYATTKDFVTFSEAKVWQDSGNMRIDTTVFEEGDTFYRFTVGGIDGCHDIFQEHDKNLTAPTADWKVDMSCLSKIIQSRYIEGPSCIKTNPGVVNGHKYLLFVVEYPYIILETDDIANGNWKRVSEFKLPTYTRHGTVMPVTAEELARVKAALK